MAEQGNFAIIPSKGWQASVNKLEPPLKNILYSKFFPQLLENPAAPGLHLEPVKNTCYSTARVDRGCRVICEWRGDNLLILHRVEPDHDKTYAWTQRARSGVNVETGAYQTYEIPDIVPPPTESGLFPESRYPDLDLLRLGVPEAQLPLVRSIKDDLDLLERESDFSPDVWNRLSDLENGRPIADMLKEIEENKAIAQGDPFRNPDTLRSFTIVDSEAALREALEAPIEEWRVFLHPDQRKLAYGSFNGPALVLGGAGTGKTVTALHRAKYLAERLVKDGTPGKILFTFYTANLAEDIKSSLQKLCTSQELARIDVKNIDLKAAELLCSVRDHEDVWLEGIYGKDLDPFWEEARAKGDPEQAFPLDFYKQEWEHIVTEQDAFSLEKYLSIKRSGSGKALNASQRKQVWKVFEAYQSLMNEAHKVDGKLSMCRGRAYAAAEPQEQYRHIIVDEAQDFSACAFRLLRALAGEERPDDLFIVGDPCQRIYERSLTLSACGVNVRNRRSVLSFNYRTTEQLRLAAVRMLEGEAFDDLDEGSEGYRYYRSKTLGEPPQVRSFPNRDDEITWIYEEIQKLTASGVSPANICLAAYTNKMVADYGSLLRDLGVRVFTLKKDGSDERGQEGVRLSTMHRVKGLEFQYMFVADVNQGVLPSKTAAADPIAMKREKCLLYVALTRAQRGGYVSGYGPQSAFLKQLLRDSES